MFCCLAFVENNKSSISCLSFNGDNVTAARYLGMLVEFMQMSMKERLQEAFSLGLTLRGHLLLSRHVL